MPVRTDHAPALDGDVLTELATMLRHDPRRFVEILDAYRREAAADLRRLHEAVPQGDRPLVASAAHRLRSSSAQLGARPLAAVLLALEGAAGSDGRDLAGLLDAVVGEYERVQAALAARAPAIS